jgi:periplasmic protein TonB
METDKILRSDFLDILFDEKNKAYGAYFLRRTYERRLAESILATILILFAIYGGYDIAMKHNKNSKLVTAPMVTEVNLSNVKMKEENPNQPPPPPPPPVKEIKLAAAIQYTTPKVVKDEMVKPEEQPPDIEQIKNKAISTRNIQGVEGGIDPNLVEAPSNGVTGGTGKEHEESKVFQFVEQMPRFPGSISDEDSREKVLEFLEKNVVYPPVAKENGIQGIVAVSFVVSADGSITDVKVISAPKGGGLDEEAMRVVKLMPKWLPGKQNGRAVNVLYTLPVRFILR